MTWRGLLICSLLLGASGCSRENAAQSTTEVDVAAAAAQTAEETCPREFVQTYEYDDGGLAAQAIAGACPGESLAGPPPFPRGTRKITLEYSEGDLFAVQESRDWTLGGLDSARSCWQVQLTQTRVAYRVLSGQRDSVRQRDGETLRSSQTGQNYGAMIALGAAITPGAGPGVASRDESTPFGVSCQRHAATSGAGASFCTVRMPPSCPARQAILPIDLRLPVAEIAAVGRTTHLRIGPPGSLVDRDRWVLP